MVNKLETFLSTHPDTKFIIGMYLAAWEEEYGEAIIMDVAETKEESQQQYEYYTSKGLKLLDENCFGQGLETMGIISCWKIPE